jgi:murein DD-endopeptidase MepM/ murein hydrolase activator NlpD
MLTVKTTAMVSLVCALATLGIAASLRDRPRSTQLQPGAMATIVPVKAAAPAASPVPTATSDAQLLAMRQLQVPVQSFAGLQLRDNFDETRGGVRRHDALDIMAPRGTPVLATDDGVVAKLFRSVAGGITIYQFDPSQKFAYYYAHLDRYRDGLKEGDALKRGEVIGYVGTTGNAPANAPHLHFTIFRLGDDKKWWKGKALNPYPYLAAR